MTAHQTQSTREFTDSNSDHERFLYAVSHDLQEPLRMVTSFLRLLEAKAGDTLDEEAKRYLDMSMENADRMKQMIYALVDLSRVGRDEEPPVSIDLNTIINELRFVYTAQGVPITLEADCAHAVCMSPTLAVRLLRILVENAVENRKPESLHVKITTAAESGGMLSVSVADDGKGMQPVYQDKVFDMFKRVGSAPGKIGAGLALARAIVQKYGGSIELKSQEGSGTIVSFTVPMAIQ
jgi:light-regulated signal transduction histidine kinase (bacteriophytochrome)